MSGSTWPRVALSGLCSSPDDIKCGPFGTQLGKDEFRSEGVPLWGIKQVNVGFMAPTHEFLEPRTALKLRQYDLRPGDIVMTRKGTVGNCAIYPASFDYGIMHSDLLRLRVDTARCDPSFLVHQLHASPDVARQLSLISGGAIMPGINVGRLKSLEVLAPPLPEQKRIADVLDRAEALRAKRRAAIAQLDTLMQVNFVEMFGDPGSNPMHWPQAPIDSVCTHVVDCPHSTPTWAESGVTCLRTSNLTKGGWDWSDHRFVTEGEYQERSKRAIIQPGDIIMSREGTVGIAAIVPTGSRFCMGQRLVQLRPNPKQVANRLLLWLLLYYLDPKRIHSTMAGSTSKHLNVAELRKLQVITPPLDRQQEFARRIAAVEKLKSSHSASLAQLDSLFASLQHRAFRGEL